MGRVFVYLRFLLFVRGSDVIGFGTLLLFCTAIIIVTAGALGSCNLGRSQSHHQPQHGKTSRLINHSLRIERELAGASQGEPIFPKTLFNKEIPDSWLFSG